MKFLLIVLATFFSLSTFASECNREAQFIGKVINLKTAKSSSKAEDHFSFQIKIGSHFLPNLACPMLETEFEEAVIKVQSLGGIKSGDEISGILIYDLETMSYQIEINRIID